VKKRQGREVGIHEDAYPDPYDHGRENGEVDIETKHRKAGKEERKGDME
jgi:hypothetical protein